MTSVNNSHLLESVNNAVIIGRGLVCVFYYESVRIKTLRDAPKHDRANRPSLGRVKSVTQHLTYINDRDRE